MAEYEVTGARYQMGEGLTLEQRTRMAEEFIRDLKEGTPIILVAEPDNPQDSEAIAVYMDYTRRVGYIKRECCKEVKLLLNSDGQCDAVVSGKDGHVTFVVEIPDAPEAIVSPVVGTRKLPDCPLPQGFRLAYSDEERALQVVAPRLVNMPVKADTIGSLLDMAERYMPLSRLSLCREDDYWRDHVLRQLRKACRLKLDEPEKKRLEQLCDELRATVGDFHRSHEHWQHRVFDRQLDLLRNKAEGKDGLFERYNKYGENKPDVIASLVRWFDGMPHVELRNYTEHGVFARRLSYIGVSRQELYEVYAAILLLDKYGGGTEAPPPGKKSNTAKPKLKPKTKAKARPSGKPMTLKYYTHGNNGVLMKQRRRVHQIFNMWNRWGWIDEQTGIADFDAFFEGEPRHCNIAWKASSTILTILLQKLLKQTYIVRQTGCAAKSLVEQQFGKTANSDRSRLDTISEERIELTLFVLDPQNHEIVFQKSDNLSEMQDIQDAALMEIFAGHLRSTKGI